MPCDRSAHTAWVDKDYVANVNIYGYNFISEPSISNAGGVGFYIKNNFNYVIRSEFTLSDSDYEALWIEIQLVGQSNIICAVMYRHPNGNLDNFMNYVNSTIEKIHHENKQCLIMGDFNIDLLRIDDHSDSENFINTLGSFCFQPQIIQPTRITSHSATLIDNIFFNSIEHFIISGNIVYDLTDHLPNFIIFNKFASKSQYYNQYFLDNIKDSKRVWNGIKQIIHFKPKTSHKAVKIINENIEMTDPYMIANAFNNYFASVGNNLANEIPNLGKSPLDYLKSSSPDSFFISPITSAEIEIEISKLKTGKATGPFRIPISVLKMLKTVIAKPLEILFNNSFSSGIVPTKFKQASVVPVYKTKSPTSLCNYRPIFLLSILISFWRNLCIKDCWIFLRRKKFYLKNNLAFGKTTLLTMQFLVSSIIFN